MKLLLHMKQAILLIFLFVLGKDFNALAQKKIRTLTLEEAIEISKDQSPDALNAKQTFQASYWDWRSYKASNLPALGLSGTLPEINQGITAQKYNGNVTYSSYDYISANANLALTQTIGVTGGSISMNSGLNGTHNVNGNNALPFVSVPINIEFFQPIFKYNRYRWDRKIMPLKYLQAKRKYIEDIE